MKTRITIYHVYQDIYNPDKQIVVMDCDYAAMHAFFVALIDSSKNFDIGIEAKPEGSK
jgi:hypothetical protein